MSYFKREGGSCENSTASFQDMRGNRHFGRVLRPTWGGKQILEKKKAEKLCLPSGLPGLASPFHPCAHKQTKGTPGGARRGLRRGRPRGKGRETGEARRGARRGKELLQIRAQSWEVRTRAPETKEEPLSSGPGRLSCSSL